MVAGQDFHAVVDGRNLAPPLFLNAFFNCNSLKAVGG